MDNGYFEHKKRQEQQGLSLGGDYGGRPRIADADFANQPEPYGMTAPQEPYGGMDMSQPYGGSALPGTQPQYGAEGDMSMFPKNEMAPPLPNFDKYKDSGFAAGNQYQDVSNAGMGLAQMRGMNQRGQQPYEDFMGSRGFQGLPYGLLGG